jgi:hypothetical protein
MDLKAMDVQMLLESSFFFCTHQVAKRLQSGKAATAGDDGVTRTVIKSLRGGRGGRQRVFAVRSDGGRWQRRGGSAPTKKYLNK